MEIAELQKMFESVDDNLKRIIETTFPDFIHECEQIEMLRKETEAIGIPKNKGQAEKKKYLRKEYNDLSQRHDSKIKIYLSVLHKDGTNEESPLVKMLEEFKR